MHGVCGIDEAGRGPLAGPVTAAAVVLKDGFPVGLLADSKALSRARRDALRETITAGAVAWGVGWASHAEIDRLDILRATHLAMRRAFAAMGWAPSEVIVDGLFAPDFGVPARTIVRADATVPEVMAASILAKTARDRWMTVYARIDARYGFERHMGYPTEMHRSMILRHGPSVIHRRSFRLPGQPS